jgi:hypothetical protein
MAGEDVCWLLLLVGGVGGGNLALALSAFFLRIGVSLETRRALQFGTQPAIRSAVAGFMRGLGILIIT